MCIYKYYCMHAYMFVYINVCKHVSMYVFSAHIYILHCACVYDVGVCTAEHIPLSSSLPLQRDKRC